MLKILGITGKWVNAVGKPQSRHSAHRERVYAGRHIKYAACVPLSEAEEQKHTDMDRGSAGGVGEREEHWHSLLLDELTNMSWLG